MHSCDTGGRSGRAAASAVGAVCFCQPSLQQTCSCQDIQALPGHTNGLYRLDLLGLFEALCHVIQGGPQKVQHCRA